MKQKKKILRVLNGIEKNTRRIKQSVENMLSKIEKETNNIYESNNNIINLVVNDFKTIHNYLKNKNSSGEEYFKKYGEDSEQIQMIFKDFFTGVKKRHEDYYIGIKVQFTVMIGVLDNYLTRLKLIKNIFEKDK